MGGRGKVYLVGAGPGDPGLLTLKGKGCLEKADVVIYDNLANEGFLDFARPGAELIYAGKRGGHHALKQEEINRLLVERASEGKVVVRLKGGDPFIFGRGGEEAKELADRGIEFEVVPGVTSAIAVPAYAGIPLTYRGYTSTVAFVTGHEDPNKKGSDIAWDKVSTSVGTLVFLMGVGNLPKIVDNLVNHGRSPQSPVAVIESGTEPEQKTVVGTLEDIAQRAEEASVKPPAIIVVGEVVGLRKWLNWFESKPLFGRCIVVTRAREQASDFVSMLQELGARCIEFPTIEVLPPESWAPLDQSIQALEQYDWVIFTSVNGGRFFLQRLHALDRDVRELKGIRIACIGPKSAKFWEDRGIKPDLVPEEYKAEAVVEALQRLGLKGSRILLPRAEKAREVLPDSLSRLGAVVDVVPAYRTIKPKSNVEKIKDLLAKGDIHMVTFTSSSTVRNFVEMFSLELTDLRRWMEQVAVACIGPITAKTAWGAGFSVHVMPQHYTIEALTEKILEYFSSP
ncbi:MAG TPA: uroporphyrinogen-III C-methyltransferase [Desulfobacterales bacterium]|nr:uroporphyrinogen-III C-methyltransferase [Desulfobacterales bacterium]